MFNFSISFDENQIISSLGKMKNPKKIGGDIHLNIDSHSFPSDRCYDYPVTILGWWLENCEKLSSGAERLVENYFMDGPHEFWVEKDSDAVEIKFFYRSPGEDDDDDDIYTEVCPSCKIPFEDYKKELQKTGNRMLNIFNENHILGEEVEHFKSLVKSLR
jgi:hypothetical protein